MFSKVQHIRKTFYNWINLGKNMAIEVFDTLRLIAITSFADGTSLLGSFDIKKKKIFEAGIYMCAAIFGMVV